MNKEKQIEEMAKVIYSRFHATDSVTSRDIAKALYAKDYRKASDVAEEIFAEIEYLIWQYDARPASDLSKEIAELKKKYTEGCDG